MSFIGGGKIVSIGNGGDGIRIGKGSVYNVAETYVANNGGSGFVQEDGQTVPEELLRAFLENIHNQTLDKDAAVRAEKQSGISNWLAEHGIETSAFAMEFLEKAQSSDWIAAQFAKYLG